MKDLVVEVSEQSVLRFFARFLLERECHETLITLLLETNISLFEDATDTSIFIQLLCFQGRWDDLLQYLKPILELYPTISKQILFMIMKQKLLETLCWKGSNLQRWILPPWRPRQEDSDDTFIDLNDILVQVNDLKEYCTPQQFNALCMFLTLESVDEHPDYKHWNHCQGRWTIFHMIQSFLSNSSIDTTSVTASTPASVSPSSEEAMTWLWGSVFSAHQHSLAKIHRHNSERPALTIDPNDHVKIHSLSHVIEALMTNQPATSARLTPRVTVRSNTIQSLAPSLLAAKGDTDIRDADFSEAKVSHVIDQPRTRPTSATASPSPVPATQPNTNPTTTPQPIAAQAPTSGREREKARPVSWTVDLGDATPLTSEEVKQPPPHIRRRMQELSVSRDEGVTDIIASKVEEKPLTSRSKSQQRLTKQESESARETAPPPSSSSIPSKVADVISPKKSRAVTPPKTSAPSPVSYVTPFLLFQTDCPIRCAVQMTSPASSSSSSVTIAIGSNAKNLHILSYVRPPPLPSSSAGGAVDYTTSVRTERTIENSHKGSIYTMDYYPTDPTYSLSGGILATGSNDKLVKLWRPHSEQTSVVLKGHTGTVRAVKFRHFPSIDHVSDYTPPTDILLASCGAGDFRPRLWDIRAESCQRILSPHTDTVHGLCWLNETSLLTGCESGTIIVHDIRTSSAVTSFSLPDVIAASSKEQTSFTRSICCLSSISTASTGTLPVSWEEALIAAGCTAGHVSFLRHSQLVLDSKIHTDDVRSIELLDYRTSSNPASAFSSAVHEVDVITSSYDMTTAHSTALVSDNASLLRSVRLQGAHNEKNLSAIVVRDSRDVITTGADGKVVLWQKR